MAILGALLKRFDFFLSGLALGLFTSRVLVEILPGPVSTVVALLALAASIIVALTLTALARKRGLDTSPLLVLYLYVVWPRIHPLLALGVGFVAVLSFLWLHVRWSSSVAGDVVLFAISLALYLHTLAPTILPADSGEFQFVSYVLGIAHPPGYALYTLLAKLFTLVPLGDVAYRVNLFSAVTGALTLVLLSRAVRRVTGSTSAGWTAAAGLAVASTFWAQSTTANIRSLTALFTALQLSALIAYAQSKNASYLMGFALAFGLGITHHTSLVPLALPYVAFLLASDAGLLREPRLFVRSLLVFLLSLLVLLYLPLRSLMGAPFDPQPIRGLSGFLGHVLALGFRGDMFYFTEPAVLLSRVKVLLNILAFEFGPAWLLLAAWGAVSIFLHRSRLLLLIGGVFLVNAVLAVTYRAPQTVEYLMPAYVALAFVAGYGVWFLIDYLRSHQVGMQVVAALWLATVSWLPALTFLRNYPSFVHLHQDRSVRQYAEQLLAQVPQGARILANWHYATPLWYLQYVEGVRPEVEVVYVYPEGAEPMAQTWLRRIEDSAGQLPTIVTNRYPEFDTTPYAFRPFAGALLVQTAPVYEVPAGVQPLDALFDGRIRFAGYELGGKTLSPADSLTVRLYWQPAVQLERDHSFFVHLVDETGAVLGQGDATHPAARYEVGRVLLDEYRIPLLPTIKPGRYRLIAGTYITLADGGWRRLTSEDGRDAVLLAEVEVVPLDAASMTLAEMHCPFAGGYTLVGVDYDRTVAGQLRLYLHWRADVLPTLGQRVMVFAAEQAVTATHLPIVPAGRYFTTAHDLPADATGLAVEVQTTADEKPTAVLGPWKINAGRRVRLSEAPADARYIPLGGEMVLVKAEFPEESRTGSPLSATLTFVGARAITHDYSVSVSLTGQASAWATQHDGTPALGAIPTLKWIRGAMFRDEHRLPMPPQAQGLGVLRLTVYDAFTVQPLPVLDERLAQMGQGTQIELGSIELR
ncbi:MAG: hypothetical protein AMJ93_00165 [Anaerolineae bacterium SM23_84]|nr:MAG: hypothetical protein AMJ93_00165 [Anaerolineae bacterium SM23_84]